MQEMGTPKLLRFLMSHRNTEPEELTGLVKNFIRDFTKGASQHDDETFMAIKIK